MDLVLTIVTFALITLIGIGLINLIPNRYREVRRNLKTGFVAGFGSFVGLAVLGALGVL